ncbi:hypothetical protein EDD22DRAFT_901174 [Suillus occidentalis]|nr:hypothetical protein EDD22DRAFT_901174 [Suillus occidentalis]
MHISYLTSCLIWSLLLIEVPLTNIFSIYVSQFSSRSTYVMVILFPASPCSQPASYHLHELLAIIGRHCSKRALDICSSIDEVPV